MHGCACACGARVSSTRSGGRDSRAAEGRARPADRTHTCGTCGEPLGPRHHRPLRRCGEEPTDRAETSTGAARPKPQKDPAPRRAGPPAPGTRTARAPPQGQQGAGDTQKARQAPVLPPAQQSHGHKPRHGPTGGRRDQTTGVPKRTRMCSSLSVLVFSKPQLRETDKREWRGLCPPRPGRREGQGWPPPSAWGHTKEDGELPGARLGGGGCRAPGKSAPPSTKTPSSCLG